MKRAFLMAGVVLVLCKLLVMLTGCGALDVARPIAKEACTVVEAVTPDSTVHTICAVESELDAIVSIVRASRSDGGLARFASGKCKIVPSRAVCAGSAELASAIDIVMHLRKDSGQ